MESRDLRDCAGWVLVSGSPPGPEPIPDAQRQSMLGWFTGDPAAWPDQARDYIGNNVVAGLPPAVMDRAVAEFAADAAGCLGVPGCNREAEKTGPIGSGFCERQR